MAEVASLETLSLHVYLSYLEEECASYVTMTHVDSPFWNPVKDRLLDVLKRQIDSVLAEPQSGAIRKRMFEQITSGLYPSTHNRNAYASHDPAPFHDEDDEDEIGAELEQIKYFGRRCCSPCCTGAFVLETMLAVIVNEDLADLVFPADLKSKIFRRKAVAGFLFVDFPSILVHFIRRLDAMSEDGGGGRRRRHPALEKLCFEIGLLGSLDSQLVHEGVLKSSVEMRRYYDFPWKFSDSHARPNTDFAMLTLNNLFSRGAGFFRHLSEIRLTNECINTRISAKGVRGGHVAVELVSGIAYSCPVLRILDLSSVASLSPECLVYLCFQDAFSLLHKYMYLPEYRESAVDGLRLDTESGGGRKHDGVTYCPWCDDAATANVVRAGCEFEVRETPYVLDDRLYDFIEKNCGVLDRLSEQDRLAAAGDDASDSEAEPAAAAAMHLNFCVKVSDLINGFTDDVFELRRSGTDGDDVSFPRQGQKCEYNVKSVGDEDTRTKLCSTMEQLLLPMDIADSKAWVTPLFLRAFPNLRSLGDSYVYEGIKLSQDLFLLLEELDDLRLEEVSLCFEDFTSYKVKERILKSIKSLVSKRPLWNTFAGNNIFLRFSLSRWIEEEIDEVLDLPDLVGIRAKWVSQIDTVVRRCPRLRKMKLSIQPSILSSTDKGLWLPFANAAHLEELHVSSSCWADVLGLLETVGPRLKVLSLVLNSPKSMRDDNIASAEFVNTVPYLCQNLERVFLGYRQGDRPHSLCASAEYNGEANYGRCKSFEATGNITMEAFSYLWRRAKELEVLKITGTVVTSLNNGEVTFNKDRIEALFEDNPMSRLRTLDVNLTVGSIAAAKLLLQKLPAQMDLVATLNVKVSIPESLEGENFGDLVSSVLGRMAAFKEECHGRRGCKVVWNWKREGILTILLQQQMLLSVSDLIDP